MRIVRLLITAVIVSSAVILPAQQPAPALEQRLQQIVRTWRDANNVPGISVGVVSRDGRLRTLTAGVSDRAAERAVAPDDLFMTGSTGKTFFAAVALQLIEQGLLDLNSPISKYLGTKPWFTRLPNATTITVRMLMTHTSGLVRYEMNPRFTADLRANPDKAWTPEEELAYLFDAKPPFAAGEGWDYSDTNYIVLGMILEGLTGTKLYDEVQQRFLTPLDLRRVVPTTSRRIPGLVPGYAGSKDPLGLPDEMMTKGVLAINPQFEWTGGGYATSAGDLARWGHALYTAKAVSAKMRDLMIAEAVPARLGPETRYGLGVIVRPATPAGRLWGHSGFFPGYQTELAHFPDLGITIAAQINSSATRGPLRLLFDIAAELK